MAENKKEISVTLEVGELMYNIKAVAYKTGQAREADGTKNYESASIMQASDDEDDDYPVRRALASNFAAMKSLLGEYLVAEGTTADNLIDKEIDSDGRLVLLFLMPSNYNEAATESMGKNAHAYLVNIVTSEWFTITNPQEAATYAERAQVSLEALKRAFYRRRRPVRPSY